MGQIALVLMETRPGGIIPAGMEVFGVAEEEVVTATVRIGRLHTANTTFMVGFTLNSALVIRIVSDSH